MLEKLSGWLSESIEVVDAAVLLGPRDRSALNFDPLMNVMKTTDPGLAIITSDRDLLADQMSVSPNIDIRWC